VYDLTDQEREALQHPSYRINFKRLPADASDPTKVPWDPAYYGMTSAQILAAVGPSANAREIKLLPNDLRPPLSHHFSLGVRQLIGSWGVQASYNGERTSHIFTFSFANTDFPCGNGSCYTFHGIPGFSNVLMAMGMQRVDASHGGVVLGPNFAVTHAFNDRTTDDPGYTDLLRVAHECSAVTAACLLTRRSDYHALGGMDEINFPVSFNDVDYCLRLRAVSRRIIFTPHARLVHLESASRGKLNSIDHAARFTREISALRHRWGEALLRDPLYNPTLSLDPIPFSAFAWPARSFEARTQVPIKAKGCADEPSLLSFPPIAAKKMLPARTVNGTVLDAEPLAVTTKFPVGQEGPSWTMIFWYQRYELPHPE